MSDRPAVTLHVGDCLDLLADLPDASVDAVITDPPYGLAELKPAQVAAAITAWAGGDRARVPDGRGFMGRTWDAFVPPPAVWDHCLRVLKPGGHLAAFAGSRTVDLMGLSIRLAGFEIRDGLTWLYGSGFPKSLDVGKAIDKAAGVEREVIGHRQKLDSYGPAAGNDVYGGGPDHGGLQLITAPATPDAVRWHGWGTTLKPAQEPIVLARKPLAGTVAANVLAHGTGALNIDACRIGYRDEADRAQASVPQPVFGTKAEGAGTYNYRAGEGRNGERFDPGAGRWPTNVLLAHGQACEADCAPGCPVAELDAQSGTSASVRSVRKQAGGVVGNGHTHGHMVLTEANEGGYSDSGGASRFFPVFRYQAKAPTSERPKVDGIAHPTVKPVALMSWLVRLLTPPGGVVLDPFAGSGTTLQAARDAGFESIGIEREFAYARLIKARLDAPPTPRADTAADHATAAAPQDGDTPLPLFDLDEATP